MKFKIMSIWPHKCFLKVKRKERCLYGNGHQKYWRNNLTIHNLKYENVKFAMKHSSSTFSTEQLHGTGESQEVSDQPSFSCCLVYHKG